MNKAAPLPENKWEFRHPLQANTRDSTGKVTMSYSFPIIKAPPYTEVLTGQVSQLSSLLTPAIINSYLLELYNAFLRVHSHRFAKNYTPAQLIKVSDYIFNTTYLTGREDEEFNFTLTPEKIDIKGNRFIIYWNVIAESVKIQLFEESEEELEEVDVTGLLTESDETKGDFLRRDSSDDAKKQLERAQLKVRIAKLKAERAIEKYVMRYGPIDPALLDSDSDNDNS